MKGNLSKEEINLKKFRDQLKADAENKKNIHYGSSHLFLKESIGRDTTEFQKPRTKNSLNAFRSRMK